MSQCVSSHNGRNYLRATYTVNNYGSVIIWCDNYRGTPKCKDNAKINKHFLPDISQKKVQPILAALFMKFIRSNFKD